MATASVVLNCNTHTHTHTHTHKRVNTSYVTYHLYICIYTRVCVHSCLIRNLSVSDTDFGPLSFYLPLRISWNECFTDQGVKLHALSIQTIHMPLALLAKYKCICTKRWQSLYCVLPIARRAVCAPSTSLFMHVLTLPCAIVLQSYQRRYTYTHIYTYSAKETYNSAKETYNFREPTNRDIMYHSWHT